MRRPAKKSLVLLSALAVVVAGAGAAFAFWTTTGSGTGEATTGTDVPIVVVQTSEITNLRPGGLAQTLSGEFDNSAVDATPVYVTSVTASIAS